MLAQFENTFRHILTHFGTCWSHWKTQFDTINMFDTCCVVSYPFRSHQDFTQPFRNQVSECVFQCFQHVSKLCAVYVLSVSTFWLHCIFMLCAQYKYIRIYQQGFRRVRFSDRWYIVPRQLVQHVMRSYPLQSIIRLVCCQTLPNQSKQQLLDLP